MSYKNLPLEKLMCPICRGILIEPVTMPCKHVLCLECFNGTMEMANLTCPLCRKRVGGWLRTAKKSGKLVNKELWTYIQTNYAEYVSTKQRGEDDDIEDVLEGSAPPPVRLSQPGEIRKEFESCQAKLEQELRIKQEAELKASEEFIKQLQEEEEKVRLEREQEDERVARELQAKLEQEAEENNQSVSSDSQQSIINVTVTASPRAAPRLKENKENKPSTSSSSSGSSGIVRGPLDAFLNKAKPLHGSSSNTSQSRQELPARVDVGRCDSITQEILHFKPINTVPVTPPKTMPDGRVLQVRLIRATPVKNLMQIHDDSVATSSPTLVKQLSTLQVERKSMTHTSKSENLTQDTRPSAFKGFSSNFAKENPVLQLFSNNKLKQNMKVPPSSTITSNSLYNTEDNDDGMDIDPVDTPNPNIVQNSTIVSPDLFADEDSVENSNIEIASSTSSANNNKYFSFDKVEREQEYKDFLFAQQLQKKFNMETDGPNLAYHFRHRTQTSKGIIKRKSSVQRKRSHTVSSQPTLKETYRRAANKNSQ